MMVLHGTYRLLIIHGEEKSLSSVESHEHNNREKLMNVIIREVKMRFDFYCPRWRFASDTTVLYVLEFVGAIKRHVTVFLSPLHLKFEVNQHLICTKIS